VKGARKDWPTLSGSMTKASAVVKQVLEFYAGSPSENLNAPTLKSLKEKAKERAVDMPRSFVNQLADVDAIKGFQAALKSSGLEAKPRLQRRLDRRMDEVLKPWTSRLPTTEVLPQPQAPTGLTSSRALAKEPAELTGRKQAGWDKVPNLFPTSGGVTTGAPNNELMTLDLASGAMTKIDDVYFQTCPTCGQIMPASQFEVDHQQALDDIRSQLLLLAQAMTADPGLLARTKKTCNEFENYFIVEGKPGVNETVTTSGWAIKAYSNDLKNLTRICRPCNGATGKSNHDMFSWYRESALLGEAFIKKYAPVSSPNDNQVIARTKDGRGWGEVLVEWFQNEHLPILKLGEEVLGLQQFAQRSLIKQATHRIAKKEAVDPTEKQKHRDKSKYHANIGKGIVQTSAATNKHFRDPRQKRFPMRETSPDRLGGLIDEVFEKDFEEKETRARKERTAFKKGQKRGRRGSDAQPKYQANLKKRKLYDEGYEQGKRAFDAEVALGVQFAIDWDASAAWDPTILDLRSEAFQQGFNSMWNRRVETYEFGRADAQAGALQPNRVAQGEHGAERLLRDYMDGFSNR